MSSVQKRLEVGEPERVTRRCFRRTGKVVQELMRHANSKITLDTYTQALSPAKRQAQTKAAASEADRYRSMATTLLPSSDCHGRR